jgi:hypothetical protein
LTTYAKKFKLNTPSLFDAIVLATGRLLKSKIVTGDEHFKNLSDRLIQIFYQQEFIAFCLNSRFGNLKARSQTFLKCV